MLTLASQLLLQELKSLLVAIELATEALSLERVVYVEPSQSSELCLSRPIFVLVALSHLILHALGEHARHSAAAKTGADVRAHRVTATQTSKGRRLHISKRAVQHASAKSIRQTDGLATRSSEAGLAGRPSRWSTELSETSQTSEATVGADTAGLAAIVAGRALTADVASEIRKRTQTTKAYALVHRVTTKSKTWQRRVRDVGSVVKRLSELFTTVLLGRFVRVRISWALRVVPSRDARASRSLLVGGL
jgi:hypothetical protein